MYESEIGRRIAVHRKALGLTQLEFARRMNVSKSTVGFWENNERGVRVGHLPAVAKELGTTVCVLLGVECSRGHH